MKARKRFVRWFKLGVVALVWAYIVLTVGGAILFGVQMTGSAKTTVCCDTPANHGFDFEIVSLTTRDGVRLLGWYIPSQNQAAIILLHGYGGNRLGWLGYAEFLARRGYGVLLYDQRACGESEGDGLSWGWRDVYDVAAAFEFVQARRDVAPARIGVMGCSTGAEIAIASAAQYDALQAIVADAPFYTVAEDTFPPRTLYDWLVKPMTPLLIKVIEWKSGTTAPMPLTRAVTKLAPRPLFLISTGQDTELWQSEYYYSLALEPKMFWNIPEATHCGGLAARPQEYAERVGSFFDQALLK